MQRSSLALACVVVVMMCVCTVAQNPSLVFFDDFDEFDLSKWEHEITMGGGGNWEFEWYTNNRTNSFVNNSVLFLQPTLTADNIGYDALKSAQLDIWGQAPADLCTAPQFYGCTRTGGAGGNILNPIQSARLRTVHSFSFKYGELQVRAKLPCGDWLWPAIWLLPKYNMYGGWPASGEIDVMESKGNVNSGANSFGSTLHMGPSYQSDDWPHNHATYTLPQGKFCDAFHIFGLVWSETGLTTYLDDPTNVVLNVTFDRPYWTKGGWDKSGYATNPWAGRGNSAPFDQEFYLIFNVAAGGISGYFPDGVDGKPWKDSDANAVNNFWNAKDQWFGTWNGTNSALQIDWVKVYQNAPHSPLSRATGKSQ